jgi:N-acetyl-anhydromuramyl-L-alanine amidase AmpD
MNFPFRIERIGSKRESWSQEEVQAAFEYLQLSEDERTEKLKEIKKNLKLEGYGTRSSTAQADSAAINGTVRFPLTSWKPSKLSGMKDIIIYKDIEQIQDLASRSQSKAA